MSTVRSVVEGQQRQGIDESINYHITTTPWGSNPTTVTCGVFERVNGVWTNVTTATTTGTITTAVGSDVITTPNIYSLTEGHTYRVITNFTVSGDKLSAYFDVAGEK